MTILSAASRVVMLGAAAVAAAAVSNTTNQASREGGTTASLAPLTWQGAVVLGGILLMVTGMAFNVVGSLASLYGLSTVFFLCGIISTHDFFSGLTNSAMLTIVLMFVIVHPIAHLPVAKSILTALLRDNKKAPSAVSLFLPRAKLCLFGWIVSPFIENVPHVAVITPLVSQVCRELGIASSRMLLPMSHAICVANWFIIGSSSNLIVQSLLAEAGTGESLSFFELVKTNGPVSALLLPYFIFAPRYLLPDNAKILRGQDRNDARVEKEKLKPAAMEVPVPAVSAGGDDATQMRRDEGSDAPAAEFASPPSRFGAIATAIESTIFLPNQCVTMVVATPDCALVGRRLVACSAPLSNDPHLLEGKIRPHGVWRKVRWLEPAVDANTSGDAAPPPPVDEKQQQIHPSKYRTIRDVLGKEDDSHRTVEYATNELLVVQAYDVIVVSGEPSHLRQYCEVLGIPFVATGKSIEVAPDPGTGRSPTTAGPDPSAMLNDAMAFLPQGFTFIFTKPQEQQTVQQLASVVISNETRGIGHRLSSCVFQTHYNCSVAAVRTSRGKHLYGVSMFMHELSEGDSLLLHATMEFIGAYGAQQLHTDFYMVLPVGVEVESQPPVQFKRLPTFIGMCMQGWCRRVQTRGGNYYLDVPDWYNTLAVCAFVGPVLYAMAGESLLNACIVAVAALVVFGHVSAKDAVHFVDWSVYVTGAMSFAIGAAMTNSGLAKWLGENLIRAGFSGFWLLLFLHVLTALIANILNNKGSIQVLFPIAVSIANEKHLPLLPLAVTVANAALGGFMTPYGLGPSLIVMGPGGYVPMDYILFGLPLSLLYAFLSAAMTATVYDFW